MYFKSIEIKNYGCIADFKYNFRFNENGNPVPCVLIGENGTGKTLVVTNLVDTLIEAKRKVYGSSLNETTENKYYKIGSKNYIKYGQDYSRVKVGFEHNNKKCYLFDIMALNGDAYLQQHDGTEIGNRTWFKDEGYYKEVLGTLTKKEFDQFIALYFPADRYYYPLWFNRGNVSLTHHVVGRNINSPKTNIVKYDLYDEIQAWLIDVYLEKNIYAIPNNIPNKSIIPVELTGQYLNVIVPTVIQNHISQILSTIRNSSINFFQGFNRLNKSLGFSSGTSSVADISQLSEGEMNLFCIFSSILKDWEYTHGAITTLDEINGCVLIDEADLGLHIDYAYRALPKLMKLFPKVQFILTSHSPFFLVGLKQEYGDNVDILNMPEGIRITDLNTFSEVKKAQQLFNDSIKELQENYMFIQQQINELNKDFGKIYIFTEGKTDVVLLNKAIKELNITDLSIEIRAATKGKCNGDDAVKSLLERLQDNEFASNLVIGLFDRDKEIDFSDINKQKRSLLKCDYIKLGNNLYAFALPIPHGRTEINDISIEHYFTDDEIKTWTAAGERLFLGNEFGDDGFCLNDTQNFIYKGKNNNIIGTIKIIDHDQNTKVVDCNNKKDVSLSKSRFAENIQNNVEGFNSFDFSEFSKIFDIIRKIKKENGK